MIRVCSIRSLSPERVELADASLVIAGSRVVAHFAACEKVTLLAATLGPGIDRFLAGLQQTSGAADAFIFNGIASAAAEHITETLDALAVREIRRSAYYPTARFSPGYGGWPLESQQQFIESIGGEKIGLTVTSHYLLQPVKSVTAVIGWSRVPLDRSYELLREKPCQGTLTCRDCPLKKNACPKQAQVRHREGIAALKAAQRAPDFFAEKCFFIRTFCFNFCGCFTGLIQFLPKPLVRGKPGQEHDG